MVVFILLLMVEEYFPARELEVLQSQHISIDRPTGSVMTTSAVLGRLCKSGADIGIGRENPVVLADALSELVKIKNRHECIFKNHLHHFFF